MVESWLKVLFESAQAACIGLFRKGDESMLEIKSLQDCLSRQNELADYVKEQWPKVSNVVLPNIIQSAMVADGLPRTYVLLKDGAIIGFYLLIEQELVSRKDVTPWISPLFIDSRERGKAHGSLLLEHARRTAGSLGYDQVYLATDHIGYYERYGFREIGLDMFEWGRPTKLYEHDTIQ